MKKRDIWNITQIQSVSWKFYFKKINEFSEIKTGLEETLSLLQIAGK